HAGGWEFGRGLVQLEARAGRFLCAQTEALAGSAWGVWVNELTLCELDQAHVTHLTRSAWLPLLAALRLPDCALDPQGTSALAGCAGLARLRLLDLRGNRMGLEGAEALLTSPHLTRLRALYVDGNRLPPKA